LTTDDERLDFHHDPEDRINNPIVDYAVFTTEEIQRLELIDPLADSSSYGCDLYEQCLEACNLLQTS
jgi:hypothetical protein